MNVFIALARELAQHGCLFNQTPFELFVLSNRAALLEAEAGILLP